MEKPHLKTMSALELPPYSAEASSASSTSSSMPPECVFESFEAERMATLRQSIRGIEAQLVDLVFESSPAGLLMDWLRVPLGYAAATGNLTAVKRLITAGVKTETPPERLRPAPLLHEAAKSENESVVEELLKAGADVHEKYSSRHNRTALHWAATAGSCSAVRALTSAGADVDVMDAYGRTPLHDACINGNRGVVVFLLLNGACAQVESDKGYPPLHLAAMHNNPGVIQDLLAFGNVCIESYNREGQSALFLAAQSGRVEACVALLRGGASAVGPAGSHGMTCLNVAAHKGHTKLLQVLTTAEATDVRSGMCSQALFYASMSDNPGTIRDLVALGADVEYRTADIIPNLHFAVVEGRYNAVEALLLAGANVDASFDGFTPLHFACGHLQIGVVQLLLYWGADENATDYDNNTTSEIVGTGKVRPDEELHPEEFMVRFLVETCIREMLENAPADRSWRRRGWLVLCRARWLARITDEEKRSSAPLASIPDCATGNKKRRGIMPLVVKPRDFSLFKGKAPGRNGGGGRHLPEATEAAAAAAVLRLGTCGVSSGDGAGQAAGVARLDGRTRFVAAVEQLLLLQEDSIFREVVTFL